MKLLVAVTITQLFLAKSTIIRYYLMNIRLNVSLDSKLPVFVFNELNFSSQFFFHDLKLNASSITTSN